MFTLYAQDLASFDAQTSSWIAEKGSYKIRIGASSHNINRKATFTLAKDIVTEKDNAVLKPQVSIQELKP